MIKVFIYVERMFFISKYNSFFVIENTEQTTGDSMTFEPRYYVSFKYPKNFSGSLQCTPIYTDRDLDCSRLL